MTVTTEKKSRTKKKSVSFADNFGLDLELIHIISRVNRIFIYTKDETAESKVYEKNEIIGESKPKQVAITINKKVLVPEFILNPEESYERLARTGLCLDSIEIYNHSFIRGVIFTMPPLTNRNRSNSLQESETESIKEFAKAKKRNLLTKGLAKLLKLGSSNGSNDQVYVIWSINDWKTWEFNVAVRQKKLESEDKHDVPVRTHEFFIRNLETLLEVGQHLQLLICNKNDLMNMNDDIHENKMSYSFKCGYKV
jgi:hypothetical protein